ncbi:MAG: GIY-YIG nuclease family protein [Planctomycetaceae bacterium]
MPRDIRSTAQQNLKKAYAEVVRLNLAREEQRRLNKQMREEAKLQQEAERELREAEQAEEAIQVRLEQALREHRDTHDAEVEELRRQLLEAQAAAERAKSMAQLTKAGHVYVLSNIGSFGEGVFKVGMTRRLDPQDRVRELGDASVPFPFDVHVMISCDNAPGLEYRLHQALTRYRVNRVNFRKEYFRVDLDTIIEAVAKNHGKIEYVAEPEALQYRESLEVTPDQLVEIEEELEELGVTVDDDDD